MKITIEIDTKPLTKREPIIVGSHETHTEYTLVALCSGIAKALKILDSLGCNLIVRHLP